MDKIRNKLIQKHKLTVKKFLFSNKKMDKLVPWISKLMKMWKSILHQQSRRLKLIRCSSTHQRKLIKLKRQNKKMIMIRIDTNGQLKKKWLNPSKMIHPFGWIHRMVAFFKTNLLMLNFQKHHNWSDLCKLWTNMP